MGAVPCRASPIFYICKTMFLGVGIDTVELQNKLSSLTGHITGKQMARALALGINKTIGTKSGGAKTQAVREITKVFNLPYGKVRGKLRTKSASIRDLIGDVKFPSKPVPLGEYKGTIGGKRRGGRAKRASPVKVEVMRGHKEEIKGGFLIDSKYGGKAVMHRSHAVGGGGSSSYNNNSFKFRHSRIVPYGNDLPIGAMFGPSPFGAEMNGTVRTVMIRYLKNNLQKNIHTMLDAMVAGFIKDANRRTSRR